MRSPAPIQLALMLLLIDAVGDFQQYVSAQEVDQKTIEYFEAAWNATIDDFELVNEELAKSGERTCRDFDQVCTAVDPSLRLTEAQRKQLEKACQDEIDSMYRRFRHDLLVLVSLSGRLRQRPTLAEFRLSHQINLRLGEYDVDVLSKGPPWLQAWKKIASPAQYEATEPWLKKQYVPDRNAYGLSETRRKAEGRFTEDELKQIDTSKTDPGSIELPDLWRGLHSNWKYRVELFVRRFQLTLSQQEAAKAIFADCWAKAKANQGEQKVALQQLWTRFLKCYLSGGSNIIELDKASKAYRNACEHVVRPSYEEMQRRLQALLTSEQRQLGRIPTSHLRI